MRVDEFINMAEYMRTYYDTIPSTVYNRYFMKFVNDPLLFKIYFLFLLFYA